MATQIIEFPTVAVPQAPAEAESPRRIRRMKRTSWSPEELRRVLRAAKEANPRDHCAMLFQYTFGLRASEVCDIKVGDVSGGRIRLNRLKGSNPLDEPILNNTSDRLLDCRRAVARWLTMRADDGSDYLFTSQKHGWQGRLDRSAYYRIVAKHASAAGLPEGKRHPHCLKHSIASHLINRHGFPAVWVQAACGHKDLRTTMQYAEINPDLAVAAKHEALQAIHR